MVKTHVIRWSTRSPKESMTKIWQLKELPIIQTAFKKSNHKRSKQKVMRWPSNTWSSVNLNQALKS